MQALFFRFFEKKLFLTHYERQKNLKKFPFFRFFLLSPPRFRLFSPLSSAKTHAKTRLKTAWKRKNGGAERFPAGPPSPSSNRARSASFSAGRSVSPRFASFPPQSASSPRILRNTARTCVQASSNPPRPSRSASRRKQKEGRVRLHAEPPGRTSWIRAYLSNAWIMSSMILTDSSR